MNCEEFPRDFFPQVSCGNTCAVGTSERTSHLEYSSMTSPCSRFGTTLQYNFRMHWDSLPEISVLMSCITRMFFVFIPIEVGLYMLSGSTLPTTYNSSCLNLISGGKVTLQLYCVPLPSYFSFHSVVLAVLEWINLLNLNMLVSYCTQQCACCLPLFGHTFPLRHKTPNSSVCMLPLFPVIQQWVSLNIMPKIILCTSSLSLGVCNVMLARASCSVWWVKPNVSF